MSIELKPCPFCGKEPTRYYGSYQVAYVQCPECGALTRTMNTSEQAIAVWNTRAAVLESREAPTPDPQQAQAVSERMSTIEEVGRTLLHGFPSFQCRKGEVVEDVAARVVAVANKHRDAQWKNAVVAETLANRNFGNLTVEDRQIFLQMVLARLSAPKPGVEA